MHPLGHGSDLLLGEPAEGVLHHLEIGVEVPGPLFPGQIGQHRRRPVGPHERQGGVQAARLGSPLVLPSERAGQQVVHRVGHEGTRQEGLGLAFGAIVEHGAGTLDRRRRMSQVVGDELVLVGPAAGREVPGGGVDGDRGLLDDDGRGVQVGGDHAAQVTDPLGGPAR